MKKISGLYYKCENSNLIHIKKTYNNSIYYTLVRAIIIRNYKYIIIEESNIYYKCECLNKKYDNFIRYFAKYQEKYSKMPAKGTEDGIWYSNKKSETVSTEDIIFLKDGNDFQFFK
jgi:hypothetical protein